MFPKHRKQLAICAVAALCLLLVPTVASAETVRAQFDGAIVVGDQLFDGGKIELRTMRDNTLMAVRIDGRQIAMVQRADKRSSESLANPSLVFDRDERGLHHLVGMRYEAQQRNGARATKNFNFRIANVAQGIETIPVSNDVQETSVASAKR